MYNSNSNMSSTENTDNNKEEYNNPKAVGEPKAENTIVLSKETTKRLLKDVKELIKHPLDSDGIYYKHDESNILKGYVYICGPKDTVYFGGNYFYKFEFPYDYPHRPPVVSFMNRDGKTRFHPNMYKSGKMCLSILNTWRGDQWTGCQSIRTILLTILSILDDKPLLHEPGITEKHRDFNSYNQIILFRNIEFSVNKIMNKKITSGEVENIIDMFKDEMMTQFNRKYNSILKILDEHKDDEQLHISTSIYNLKLFTQWNEIYSIFKKIERS